MKIGTSGIVLPGNKSTFPLEFQSQTRLHYFATLFNSLEVNSSFYKIPKFATFEKWASEVPDDFKFSVKLWRGITHAKKLAYSLDDLTRFMDAAEGLGTKKGCLLVQFPASIRIESYEEVAALLRRIADLNANNQWQLAVEFRHIDWYFTKVYDLLSTIKSTLVMHDMPNSTPPVELLEYFDPTCLYLRFHGPSGQYTGSYSNQFVDEYAEFIKKWRSQGKLIYVYFNNTIGSALQNAQRLQHQLR
ncbi:DUF72 domain-containing protein [Cellvibrio zantedeschiae]|uniref:DUF72 domain-containing protein n=1 Tax=Cellvibrio zantedeschiae TaxID=1237077 RepID=UPI001E3D7B02|nr:DUF72 domain-containing protein [Cellvibrio zantedeschiae]